MSANLQDEACANIHARGFWGQRQGAFFDIRVFHPTALSRLIYPVTLSAS